MLRRAGPLVLLAATGLVAAVVVARLPPDLDTAVVTRYHHGGDPLLSAALLRFGASSLLHEPSRYFRPPILYPDPNPLRGTEPLVAEAIFALPFRLALGDRPAAVYTCVKIATLALLSFATGLLLREIGVRPSLCVLAGSVCLMTATTTVFGDRLQAVSFQWLPLTLLFAWRFLRRGRAWEVAAFAVALFLTVQSSLYTAVMLLGAAPFLAAALRPIGRVEQAPRRLLLLAAAAGLAAAASLLLLRGYLADRADVAAYSTADYAAEKSWNPFCLADALASPPEYPPQAGRLAPRVTWDGLFPGMAFILFVAAAAGLSAVSLMRRGAAHAAHRPRPIAGSRLLLAFCLLTFGLALASAATRGPTRAVATAAAIALWGALAAWCWRLLRWPDLQDESECLRFFASASALAAFVCLVLGLGSPIRFVYFGEPLAQGLFGPLSAILPPLREMRELKRYLPLAGWAAVVAAAAVLELRLRSLPRAAGPALAVALLAVGFAERTSADTRKAQLPPLPAGYELLSRSTQSGGLLELPFDGWGQVTSVHRMLWQPRHGRPIAAGRTGLDPAWYSPALAIFNSFPSDESVLLLRAWGIDSVLDTRGESEPPWPDGVALRGRLAGERGEWRLLDVLPKGGVDAALAEPALPAGRWEAASAHPDDAQSLHATDGSLETAAVVTADDGLTVALPSGKTPSALELDYGNGRFAGVPPELRVLARTADGDWRDVTDPASARFLRARAANQLLRRRSARLVVLLQPLRASELRLVSAERPWELPELRVRVAD